MRYDHSTGYVGGWQISPRIGVNIWDGGKNVAHVYYGRFYAAPLLEDVRQACVLLSAQQACSTTNPVYDLKPESDSYFEMGVVHSFNPHFTGSLNVFKKSVVNVLDTTQLFNTPIFAVYNNSIGINHGAEMRLAGPAAGRRSVVPHGTVSGSYAACISGSTFLFPPNSNEPGISCVAQLSLEDHSQTVDATAGYTPPVRRARNFGTRRCKPTTAAGFPYSSRMPTSISAARFPHTRPSTSRSDAS